MNSKKLLYNYCFNCNNRSIAIVGLVLIAIGTGGIKPCAYTFGGDQFQLPEQKDQLAKFFNRFLIAIYIGALVSTFLTPELRKSVQCFGRNSCFPLAFGMLSLLMILAIGNIKIVMKNCIIAYIISLFILYFFFICY